MLGLLVGFWAEKFEHINFFPTFLMLPLTFLGGVFYSVSLLPPWAEKLSYVNPILYMVNAFRHGFLGTSDVSLGFAFLIMAAFAAAMFTVVVMLMNRGAGIRAQACDRDGRLLDDFDATYSFVGNIGPIFYFVTNLEAPRSRLIAIDTRSPDRAGWKELIPESSETLQGVNVVNDSFVASYLKDAATRVNIFALDGKPLRMDHMVRDAFWAGGQAVVLLDPRRAAFDTKNGEDRFEALARLVK